MRKAALLSSLALLTCAAAGCGAQDDDGGKEPVRSATGPSGEHRGPRLNWAYEEIVDEPGGLTDLAVLADDDIWAAGKQSGGGADPGRADHYLLHYDGTDWTRSPMPGLLGDHVWDARLASLGSGGLWLWGESRERNSTAFAHWDGERWTSLPTGPSGPVTDTAVFEPDDVWLLTGERRVWHWDGERWSSSELPHPAAALDGTSSDDLWAVGHRTDGPGIGGDGQEMSQPAAMHYDGKSWTTSRTPVYRFADPVPPEPGASLTSVLALAPDRVLALGSHSFNHGEVEDEPADETVRLRWDGSTWLKQDPWPADCEGRAPIARDASRGLFLDGNRYLTTEGACTHIKRPRLPNTGGVTPQSQQSLWLERVVPVPGGDKVLGVGHVQVNQSGNPMSKAVVVSLRR
ncbi:hypothetical protein HUT18_22630 [Streptomyces sp. NA04227]|uniref:hypothetical protein n=1 Tax=Streptomyces sp. NA04227 TaxID=2742136 RepID=UPI00158FEDDC|nr:hypothetical protein [Streptomyces sp. NA04227]QKW08755.1 hypothetical protein HUT18_22630 [Streptomyces sp. NA04227]